MADSNSLNSLTTSSSLSAFNFFNLNNANMFYAAADAAKSNYVLSTIQVYRVPGMSGFTAAAATIASGVTLNLVTTGMKLCYGSQVSTGTVILYIIVVSNSHA